MGRLQKDRITASRLRNELRQALAVKCLSYVFGNEKMAAKKQEQQRKILFEIIAQKDVECKHKTLDAFPLMQNG
jgi:hypothetical protein